MEAERSLGGSSAAGGRWWRSPGQYIRPVFGGRGFTTDLDWGGVQRGAVEREEEGDSCFGLGLLAK